MKNKISKTKCKVSKKNNVLYLRLPETNLPPMEIYKLNKDIIKIVRPRQSRYSYKLKLLFIYLFIFIIDNYFRFLDDLYFYILKMKKKLKMQSKT